MFGSKKKEETSALSLPSAGANALNSLVKGTTVEGTLVAENDMRIDGTIKGKINGKSKVIIGPTGFVEGEIRCASAVIEGKFHGILHVNELLIVKETAEVVGDVFTDKLNVQTGAIFNVVCKMNVSNGVPKQKEAVVNNTVKA